MKHATLSPKSSAGHKTASTDKLTIRRAVVLGAGVMGAQIAAALAAAGVRVHLLDLAMTALPQHIDKDIKEKKLIGKNIRNARALMAIEGLKSLKPAPYYSAAHERAIIPGNFDDDLSVCADADWVLEAVIEKLEIKQSIHKRLADVVRPGIPVTTNTSGISLRDICSGLPEHYQANFFGTHFFNPPRYMRLLEIIPHDNVDTALVTRLSDWIAETLGKGIVDAFDTVNFIANRIGVFANQATLRAMQELGLNIETVDALTGKLMGRPASASFRTMDVVGLDTFAHVARNTYDRATKDPYRDLFKMPDWITALITSGRLGQKTGDTGCYKKASDAKGKRVILVHRPGAPAGQDYVEQTPEIFPWMEAALREGDLGKRLSAVIAQKDKGAELVWRVLRDVFSYSALLVEEIAGGLPKPLDEAIKWGFNWEAGPFELWQRLGYDSVLARMQAEKVPLPGWAKPGVAFYDPVPGSAEFALSGARAQTSVVKNKAVEIPRHTWQFHLPKRQPTGDPRLVLGNRSASLVDVGDGVSCLVFHSKMNAIDAEIIETTQKAIAATSAGFAGMIIANDGEHFSAGANLKLIAELITRKDFAQIDRFLRDFQGTMQLIKFAGFPTVSCPQGLTLGGGCEVALHTTRRLLHGETYAGLVEIGVGLLPGGGGTKELALRAYDLAAEGEKADPMPFLQRMFFLIGMAKTSTSGHEALDMGLLPRATSTVTLSRDHQILKAKREILHMAGQGYVPALPRAAINVVGDPGIQTFRLALYNMVEGRQISAYDSFIAERVATVLCGGAIDGGQTVSEQYLLELERTTFVELCHQEKTFARIEHMLKTGSPLRN